jgi:glycerol-3-phosphate dehydrogenase
MRILCPLLTSEALQGGFRFFDAQTDDARLVLRLIRESVQAGAVAINYANVISLIKTNDGQVCGVVARDCSGETEQEVEIRARVVINAAGSWADQLRAYIGKVPRLRPLRGSHLVFQANRLPLSRAITFLHPSDGRPVFILPWEGAVIYGTTDVDQGKELPVDPKISEAEIDYLLEGIQAVLPAQELSRKDVIATFSGIRPVVDTGKSNPSKESREHVLWDEDGLLTVSGGKLTTFRIMARDALKAVRRHLGYIPFNPEIPVLDPLPTNAESTLEASHLPANQCLRLIARYGIQASASLCTGTRADMELISGTPYLWGELRQAAREEGVVHLDDLLLRRIRLGLLLPNGGMEHLDRIRIFIQADLGWDDDRWRGEAAAYRDLWNSSYSI